MLRSNSKLLTALFFGLFAMTGCVSSNYAYYDDSAPLYDSGFVPEDDLDDALAALIIGGVSVGILSDLEEQRHHHRHHHREWEYRRNNAPRSGGAIIDSSSLHPVFDPSKQSGGAIHKPFIDRGTTQSGGAIHSRSRISSNTAIPRRSGGVSSGGAIR